ncbi:MAG: pilus assembly protein CpaF [Firmicutes bacterium HGW-Firmicutes-2]|nr:MAG: pilus assembly protein CpaF [Firmicutes bacterium HGW-Firmicutes-2]
MLNFIMILVVLLVFVFILMMYFRKGDSTHYLEQKLLNNNERFQFEAIVDFVKDAINDITRTNLYEMGLSEDEFKRRLNKRSELKKALKNCTYGSVLDKEYVKDFICDLLKKNYITEKNVDKIMHFGQPNFLSIQDKFEILLYQYKKSYGSLALSQMIQEHNLDDLKHIIENGKTPSYIITSQEIEAIFSTSLTQLSYEDKLKVITQRVYQIYKGFGVVDEIRDMAIDGVSGGVSGVVEKATDKVMEDYLSQIIQIPNHYDSIWIFYKGKSIHLDFLSFGSEKELRRICQNIYRYNKAGQLSESTGFKVNEMKDGSRVVVVRPGFSESWAFFVRKFHIANVTLEELISDENASLPIETIRYLIKGARIISITGSQGSGKTTLLMAMVEAIYGTLTLRVQEMAFELHLRKVYPMRNILTFKETPTITGQSGMDVQKKTDGSVSILGEIATDEVAVWMLQMAQVASLFTLFTHHAKTVKDLVLSLRNSLLKCEIFRDEKIAEQQVVSVLDFDIHMERDGDGKRYISRITEIVASELEAPYKRDYRETSNQEDQQKAFMDTMTEYFTRMTDRKKYESRDVVVFDGRRYKTAHRISKDTISQMEKSMSKTDYQGFVLFQNENWGCG